MHHLLYAARHTAGYMYLWTWFILHFEKKNGLTGSASLPLHGEGPNIAAGRCRTDGGGGLKIVLF
jgi:hypothetical protein